MASEYDGIIKLAYAIVQQCCEDYREAYIKGKANDLLKCKTFLLSGKVEIYTLCNFHGKDIIKQMNDDLRKKYGTFEERKSKNNDLYKKKIESKKQQLNIVRAEIKELCQQEDVKDKEREQMLIVLRNRRYRLIGEINRLKREAKD